MTEFRFIKSNMTISIICSELLIFGGDKLSLTVHVHKLECLVKRLLCYIQGQFSYPVCHSFDQFSGK